MKRSVLIIAVFALAGCSFLPFVGGVEVAEQNGGEVVVQVDEGAEVDGEPVKYVLLVDESGDTVDAEMVDDAGRYTLQRDGSEVAVAYQNIQGGRETIDLE